MEGGASGEVVFGGDLESSRLWTLVSHEEKPGMPPNQDRIADAKLELIRNWIVDGAVERLGGQPRTVKKPNWQFEPAESTRAYGTGVMPEGMTQQPVDVPSRPATVTSLATSPTAPLIAVAGQRQVVLYHTETGDLLGVVPFPAGVPQQVQL